MGFDSKGIKVIRFLLTFKKKKFKDDKNFKGLKKSDFQKLN